MPCQTHCLRACFETSKLGYKPNFLAGQETMQVQSKSWEYFKFTDSIKKSSNCGKINCFLNTSNGAYISVLKVLAQSNRISTLTQ